ncbi:MAG: imidazole glycerol phosphate synthase subunit HisH [Cyclobacteriaceae bacterium]|nr:imidazole glycerol phosphate synthase subunit HisH [Cyclobacteriaceae bacterium]
MKLAVIRYNAGNVQSVSYALERLGVDFVMSDDPETIMGADKVLFPGVGEASTTMEYLRKYNLDQLIPALRQPVLGICLGMQLLCRFSEENNTHCLGIIDTVVRKFKADETHKVPQMGWNNLVQVRDWIPAQLEQSFAYFVHSYFVPVSEYTSATCEYGVDFSAAIRHKNFYAVQFHPEKSAATGQLILEAFLKS